MDRSFKGMSYEQTPFVFLILKVTNVILDSFGRVEILNGNSTRENACCIRSVEDNSV